MDTKCIASADLIVIQRYFPAPATLAALELIFASGKPVVFDIDDNFHDISETHPDHNFISRTLPYIDWVLCEADLITVSTQMLRISIQRHTLRPVAVIKNLIDWNLFYSPPPPVRGKLHLLVSGTSTHLADWALIEDDLDELLATYPERLHLTFIGALPQRFSRTSFVSSVGFNGDYSEYARTLKSSGAHVALVPLLDTTFNRAKSNIKWLEYSASGILGVFSNLEPYQSSVQDNINGILVSDTHGSWKRAIVHLLDEPSRIQSIVSAAQKDVFDNFSIATNAEANLSAVLNLLDKPSNNSILAPLHRYWRALRFKPRVIARALHRHLQRHFLWRFTYRK